MKTIPLLTAVLVLAAGASAADLGKPSPDFTTRDIKGQTHQLSALKGKIVVLESYNLDCPFVRNH